MYATNIPCQIYPTLNISFNLTKCLCINFPVVYGDFIPTREIVAIKSITKSITSLKEISQFAIVTLLTQFSSNMWNSQRLHDLVQQIDSVLKCATQKLRIVYVSGEEV